jgi:hypothetical protein
MSTLQYNWKTPGERTNTHSLLSSRCVSIGYTISARPAVMSKEMVPQFAQDKRGELSPFSEEERTTPLICQMVHDLGAGHLSLPKHPGAPFHCKAIPFHPDSLFNPGLTLY